MSPEETTEQKLTRVAEDVAYIRGTIDHYVVKHVDHESRLRSLERWKWGIPGTVVAGLLTLLGIHTN